MGGRIWSLGRQSEGLTFLMSHVCLVIEWGRSGAEGVLMRVMGYPRAVFMRCWD